LFASLIRQPVEPKEEEEINMASTLTLKNTPLGGFQNSVMLPFEGAVCSDPALHKSKAVSTPTAY
jgi:hypothetical protein